MSLPLSGFGFLFGYIVLVGTASFLEKFSMKQLNPNQVNFLMAIGMAVTAVPALWLKQGNLTVPAKALPLGAPIGLLRRWALFLLYSHSPSCPWVWRREFPSVTYCWSCCFRGYS